MREGGRGVRYDQETKTIILNDNAVLINDCKELIFCNGSNTPDDVQDEITRHYYYTQGVAFIYQGHIKNISDTPSIWSKIKGGCE